MAENRRAMLVLIVLCGVIISICMGLRQTLGLFQRSMVTEAITNASGDRAPALSFTVDCERPPATGKP